MRYKVGNKVIIRDDLIEGRSYDECYFIGDMVDYLGKTVKIEDMNYEDRYKIEFCDLSWTDEMIDHEKTNELNNKTFKTWEIMKMIDENYEEIEGKTFKMVGNEKHTWSTIGIGSKVQVSSSSHSGKGLYEDGSKVYVSGSEIWEEADVPRTFEEVMMFPHELYSFKLHNCTISGSLNYILEEITRTYKGENLSQILFGGLWFLE